MFNPLKEQKPDIDNVTRSIYLSHKMIWRLGVKSLDRFKPEIRKHLDDMRTFMDLYEAGQLKHWWDYYKRAEEMK